jgi:hypothetical protein
VIAGPAPLASGFYASRISSKLGWIYNVVDPDGDVTATGSAIGSSMRVR